MEEIDINYTTGRKAQNRDVSNYRDKLASWCASRFDGNELVELDAISEEANGRAGEIFTFSLTDESKYILRRQAMSDKPMHMNQDFESEYAVQRELSDKNIPVCKTYFYEADGSIVGSPFYVMEYIDGRVPQDEPSYHHSGWMTELSPEEQTRMCQSSMAALARLHQLDPHELSLERLFNRARPGFTHNDWLIDHWRQYHRWTRGDNPYPQATKALDWLEANRIENETLSISWGDARPGNTIYQGAECAALIDFDITHLAAPEKDLAWWLTLDYQAVRRAEEKRLPGWLSVEELIATYEEASGRKIDRDRLHYYTVWTGVGVLLFIDRTMAISPDVTEEITAAMMASPVMSPLFLLEDIINGQLW